MSDYSLYIFPLISGVVIAIVTQIIAHYFSEKSLKTQRELSLTITRMQLYHEDRKDALVKLDELLKQGYKSFPDFRNAVTVFLDGSTGLFLPEKLREELKKEIDDIDTFLTEKQIEIYGEPPDLGEEDEYEEWFADLPPEDQANIEITDRLSKLKGVMRDKIKKHISEG
ncbi:MAG: hypothetical protein WCD81_09745 [Candidatus Bathyarchaeia archaeon]